MAAQTPSLAECVPAPLLYMAVESSERPDVAAAACDLIRDLERIGIDLSGIKDRSDQQVSGGTLDMLLGVLQGSASGSVRLTELALAGVVPQDVRTAGLPLLIARAVMSDVAAASLRHEFDAGQRFRMHRTVRDQTIYAAADGKDEPGAIELVLVQNDLLIANYADGIDEVLLGTGHSGGVLAGNNTYRGLRDCLVVPSGSVVLYADFARLRRRVIASLPEMVRLPLQLSGVLATQGLLLALSPGDGGVRGTLLLSMPDAQDGALALAQAANVEQLVGIVPERGPGGIAMALDPIGLLRPESSDEPTELAALRSSLHGRCQDLGLDLDQQVLARLGRICGVRLVNTVSSGLAPVFVLETKPQAARRLLADCEQAFDAAGEAGSKVHLGVSGGSIVVAPSAEALQPALVHSAPTGGGRALLEILRRVGLAQAQVGGVFRLDLRPTDRRAADVPTFLRRNHVGWVEISGRIVRFEMLSSH